MRLEALPRDGGGPAIEMLLWRPSSIPAFLQADAGAWTPWLERQPGFGGKLQLTNCPDDLGTCSTATFAGENASALVLELIFWQSREQWKAITVQDLLPTGKQFNETYVSITGSPSSLSSTAPTALPVDANGEGFNVARCTGSWCSTATMPRQFTTGNVVAIALGSLVAGMLLCACLARAFDIDLRKGQQRAPTSSSGGDPESSAYRLHVDKDGAGDSSCEPLVSSIA